MLHSPAPRELDVHQVGLCASAPHAPLRLMHLMRLCVSARCGCRDAEMPMPMPSAELRSEGTALPTTCSRSAPIDPLMRRCAAVAERSRATPARPSALRQRPATQQADAMNATPAVSRSPRTGLSQPVSEGRGLAIPCDAAGGVDMYALSDKALASHLSAARGFTAYYAEAGRSA